jgi:hypothetical protein
LAVGWFLALCNDPFHTPTNTHTHPSTILPGAPLLEQRHELALQLRPGGAQVASARLTPPAVPIDDIVAAAAAAGGAGGARAVASQVQLRLLQHWSLQALVDAAAQRFPLFRAEGAAAGAAAGGGRVYEASLPSRSGFKLQIAVPGDWPRLAAGPAAAGAGAQQGLRLAGASGVGLDVAALMAAVEADAELAGSDLLGFLKGVNAKVEAMTD